MKRLTAGVAASLAMVMVALVARGAAARAEGGTPPEDAQASPSPESAVPTTPEATPRPISHPAPLGQRVFSLRYRKLDDAYVLISPYVGPRGSVRMQPAQRTLTVQETPENLARIGGVLTTYDVPPRNVQVAVQLILASAGGQASPSPAAPPIRGVIDKLSALSTRWTDYTMVGDAHVRGTEGEHSSLRVGDDYKVDFRIDQVLDENHVIRFKPFELSRREPAVEGPERYAPIMNTVLNLRDSQQFIVGASKVEQSQRALFMTITASLERP